MPLEFLLSVVHFLNSRNTQCKAPANAENGSKTGSEFGEKDQTRHVSQGQPPLPVRDTQRTLSQFQLPREKKHVDLPHKTLTLRLLRTKSSVKLNHKRKQQRSDLHATVRDQELGVHNFLWSLRKWKREGTFENREREDRTGVDLLVTATCRLPPRSTLNWI